MPEREENLRCFIQCEFKIDVHCNLKKPTKNEFYNSKFDEDLKSLYRNLGGILDKYPTGFKGYDVRLKDKVIELDEEQHFNRYRLTTINSPIYVKLQADFINQYKQYCQTKENECLKKASNRNYWTNESSEKQFGKSDKLGSFVLNGSARWKQRAFYDVLRDVTPKINNYKVFRIAIYDTLVVQDYEITVAEILDDILNKDYHKSLKKYLEDVIGITSSIK